MSYTSPSMSLLLSTIGVDSGLSWEQNLNLSLTTIDQHNHAPGSGIQIQPNGLNINTDLPINSNNLTLVRTTRFVSQASALSLATDLNCVYVTAGNLYYNDGSGNQVQITASGLVNATSSGISSGTATASFSGGVLIVNAAANTPANIQGASLLLGNNVANSKYLTLSPPSAMAANYSLILPIIPAALSFVTIDASGNITGSILTANGLTASNIANATITHTQISNTAGILGTQLSSTAGIVGGQIANNTIGDNKMISKTLTNASIAFNTVSPFEINSSPNFNNGNLQINGRFPILSNTNAANSLKIVRGFVNAGAGIISGEGFSITNPTAGQYNITYSAAFSVIPVVVATTADATASIFSTVANQATTGFSVFISTTNNNAFNFIVIGL